MKSHEALFLQAGNRAGEATLWRRLGNLVESLRRARRRAQTIAQLQHLDDRLLDDIGIERGQISAVVDTLIARGAHEAELSETRAENLDPDQDPDNPLGCGASACPG